MGRRFLARRAVRLAAAACAAVGVAAGGAFTASALTGGGAGSTGVIHACSNPGNGNLRIVTGASQCHSGEQAVEWNVVGPQGVPGVQGPKGDPGPAGPGLAGSACSAGGVDGTVAVAFASDGSGSIRCVVASNGGGGGTTTTTGGTPPECDSTSQPPVVPNATAYCNGTWQLVCNTGWFDADGTVADGCEFNLGSLQTDPHNCGQIGNDVTNAFPHATAACVNGVGVIAACDLGWYDLDGNPADGCESQDPGCSPTYTHSTGLGQTFVDCTPVGSYSLGLAIEAAAWWRGTSGDNQVVSCSDGSGLVATTDGAWAVWVYSGSLAGYVSTGSSGTDPVCPTSSDPAWQ